MSSSPSTAVPASFLDGMEVPIPGCDNLKWTELTIPPLPRSDSIAGSSPQISQTPSTSSIPRGTGSCHVIAGDTPAYLIWRIDQNHSHLLDVVELFPSKYFYEKGLRLVFSESLHPFSFIYKHEVESTVGNIYMIYALTVSGIAYLLKVRSPNAYASGSVLPSTELIALDVQNSSYITAVEATSGCLMVGRHDGSVSCYQLGKLDQRAPGFMLELRDDVGIGRLWSIMSRGKVISAVQHLVLREMFGRKYLFVAHVDGILRAWDLLGNTKILNHSISLQESTVGSFRKFWIGDANFNTCQCFLVALHEGHSGSNFGMIALHTLNFNTGDRLVLSLEPSVQYIPLDEGKLVDLKITCDMLWILTEMGPMLYNLSCSDIKMKKKRNYNLHEEFVAEQLFQCSEHPCDDRMWTSVSLLSSAKDQIPYVISSIFLRRILQPGISLSSALSATILDQKKYTTDYEKQSLSISGLKRELLSIIESEGVATDPLSMLQYWKKFCSNFFHHWYRCNTPYGLFIDSGGSVGLIRRSSISLFRQFQNIEAIIYGSYGELCGPRNSSIFAGSNLDFEIISDVLRSASIIKYQLGRASSSVFYEALLNPSIVSYEDTLFHLLKVLEAGHNSTLEASLLSQGGDDTTWQKKHSDHKHFRKFSVDILFSLIGLLNKATTWGIVLDTIELYLENFLPDKHVEHIDSQRFFSINSSLLIQATCQVAGVIIDCAFGMLMLLEYLANVSIQVHMVQSDITRLRLKIIPMIEDIIMQWHILHLIGTTQTESVALEDFSSQLSSLHIVVGDVHRDFEGASKLPTLENFDFPDIRLEMAHIKWHDKKTDHSSWDGMLGTYGFTLSCLLEFPIISNGDAFVTSKSFSSLSKFVCPVWNYCSWILCGRSADESNVSLHPSIEIAGLLLQYGQYEAAENLLFIIDTHLSKKKSFGSIIGGGCACIHLLGYCLVLRAQNAPSSVLKHWKIREAVRCFFRASSGEGASIAIQKLSFQTGFHCSSNNGSAVLWKFFYFQWVMQIFDQYNLSEAACQFALSALAQVDKVIEDDSCSISSLLESPNCIKGRLWANIFKFTIDLGYYGDAYCAIVSNPDEDNKYICLRRFIIVLYEQGESKILCNGEFPFVGLVEKVEQELFWKAERSDISSRPNLYKLLYAFQMYRSNWRRASRYMYHYSYRLKQEIKLNEKRQVSSIFQEILCALSAAINALQLVHPSHAWIDTQHVNIDKLSPNKRPQQAFRKNASLSVDPESQMHHFVVDIEMLEKDYVLTLAQYLLSTVDVKCIITDDQFHIVTAVEALVEANLYDMAFTVVLKVWKGCQLKRELERVFVTISRNCCANEGNSFNFARTDVHRSLVSRHSDAETFVNGKVDVGPCIRQTLGNSQWEILELYLEKYKMMHPRLPVTVAETLLYTDPQIGLPLWLVRIFKGSRSMSSWGMTGQEADPATLFRLYVDYGRYAEATNLLIEYIDASSLRTVNIMKRKKMSSVCFPHVAVERLWCQLQDVQSSGYMIKQCDKLKNLLSRSIDNHLKQVKVDSDDAFASSTV